MCKPSKRATEEGGARGHGQNMLLIHSFLKELPSHRHHGFNLRAGEKKPQKKHNTACRCEIRQMYSELSWLEVSALFVSAEGTESKMWDNVLMPHSENWRWRRCGWGCVSCARLSRAPFETCFCSARTTCAHGAHVSVFLFIYLKNKNKKGTRERKTSPRFWQCGPNEVFISSADFASKWRWSSTTNSHKTHVSVLDDTMHQPLTGSASKLVWFGDFLPFL